MGGLVPCGSPGYPSGSPVLASGTVFRMTPAGTLTTLAFFTGGSSVCNSPGYKVEGGGPNTIIQGSDNNFYGTTGNGGSYGLGTVFKMTNTGTITTLFNFNDTSGAAPLVLIQGNDGNFYGTTRYGYTPCNGGVAYKITTSGVYTTLVCYSLTSTISGHTPNSLIQGSDDNFYGTTYGASNADGTVFRMTPAGTFTRISGFSAINGSYPLSLTKGSDGNFYGTTQSGGSIGAGTAFKVTASGALTTVFNFDKTGASSTSLLQGSDGNFYGVASYGGNSICTYPNFTTGCGSVFRLSGVTPPSTITSLSPTSGTVGTTIIITGTNFIGARSVTFGGVNAAYVVNSSTQITATVPPGAITGQIKVDSSGNTATSVDSFTVIPSPPKITSFSPSSGAIGTSAVITGASFTNASAVTFGSVSAPFVVNSDTEIVAAVPQGATSAPISVTTPYGVGTSSTAFNITDSLSLVSLSLEQESVSSIGQWISVPNAGITTDGNRIRLTVVVQNNSPLQQTINLTLKDDLGKSLPATFLDGSTTVAGNGMTTVRYYWDTSGYAWNAGQQRLQTQVTAQINAGAPKVVTVSVLPKPVIILHGWNDTAASMQGTGSQQSFYQKWNGRAFVVGDCLDVSSQPCPANSPVANAAVMKTGGPIVNPPCLVPAPPLPPFEVPSINACPELPNINYFTVPANAEVAARYIRAIQQKTNAWHVDLVAHSMGGLISRSYIQSYMQVAPDSKPTVTHLLTFGTPHLGSDYCPLFVIVPPLLSSSAMQLLPSYLTNFFNQQNTNLRGVKISVLAGPPLFAGCAGLESNDSVVKLSSAFYNYSDRYQAASSDGYHIGVPLLSPGMMNSQNNFNNFTFSRLALDSSAYTSLSSPLTSQNSIVPDSTPNTNAASTSPSQLQISFSTSALLTAGATINIVVPVDPTVSTTLSLYAPASVTSTLLDPTGQVVSTVSANTPEASQLFRSIAVPISTSSSSTQNWTVRLTQTNTTAADATILLSTQITNTATILSLDLGQPDQNRQVQLNATLTDSSSPVVGANAVAHLYSNNNTSLDVALFDDGQHGDGTANNGVYGAITPILTPGDYVVTAEATTSGYMRSTSSGFSIQAKPNLTVQLQASPSSVTVGQQLTYQLTVKNNGIEKADDVWLSVQLDPKVSLISNTTSQGISSTLANSYTVSAGTLGAGQSMTVSLVVTPNATGTINTTATATSTGADTNSADNTATLSTTVNDPSSPTISSFAPSSGPVGTSVIIAGSNFSNLTNVQFNGISAMSYIVNSPTQVTATVPAGATTGPISITNAIGTVTSSTSFTVSAGTVATGYRFYPVAPCRIVDTRNTSIPTLSANVPTSLVVNGGGPSFNYSAQGGSASGCGIPSDAKAVFLNFVAVSPGGSGYFQAWPFGTSIPTASVLNYANAPGLNIANGIVLPVCDPTTSTCIKDLNVQANQASIKLVLDVVGYFK